MNTTTNTVPFNFSGIPLAAIEHEEDLWLTGEDIGNALEYKDPGDAIKKIYKRNQTELDQHSVIIKIPVSYGDAGTNAGVGDAETGTWGDNLSPHVGDAGSERPPAGTGATRMQPVRVFNEEGVMILTMLSSQPKAAQFRAWAVGVLKAFRHGNLALSTPVNRHRLLETCIKEARFGNPVAVHTLIQHFGYPETIRREIKTDLMRRALRQPARVPELVDWYFDTFLPRLRDEIEGQPGHYLKELRNRPPYYTSWREIDVEGARWCLSYRSSDMYTFACQLAEQEEVDVEISSQLFTRWMRHSAERFKSAGFERVDFSQVHQHRVMRLILRGEEV